MGESEIARLRHQFELECEGLRRGLYGLSTTAKHKIIAHKYTMFDTYHGKLTNLVGERKATEIMIDMIDKVVD